MAENLKIEQLKRIRDAMQILINGGPQNLPYALSQTEYAKVQRAQRLVNQLIDEEGKKE